MISSSVRRSGSCRKLSSIPPRVQSRCVRSFRVSCFNWCCNAFSSLMAFRSFFSLFSNSRLSFSSFEVSGKGSVLLSRYQHINPVRFSHALTHPHDKSGSFQFLQRTLDRHGPVGQDCGVSLPLVRSFWSGFLHIPAKSHGTTSPGKHIPHRLVIRLE